jgi:hypothetical protein
MSEPFITAEESTSPFWGVWVLLSTLCVKLADGTIVPHSFVITTSSGYRATLPACGLEHADGFINCTRKIDDRRQHAGMSVDAWLKHCRTHCHSYHLPLAQDFRDRVQKTYGKRPTG